MCFLCFPFPCDNLSSKKFLKFSFSRDGIDISQFVGPPLIVTSIAF